jgi:hypothetical protein
MLAVTPSESREVTLFANSEFEPAVSRGIEPAPSSTEEIRLSAIHFWLWPRIGCPGTASSSRDRPSHLLTLIWSPLCARSGRSWCTRRFSEEDREGARRPPGETPVIQTHYLDAPFADACTSTFASASATFLRRQAFVLTKRIARPSAPSPFGCWCAEEDLSEPKAFLHR